MGALADKTSPWLLATSTLLLSSISTFVFWGVTGNATAGVLVFGVSYGLVAGGWSSLWSGFVKPIASTSKRWVHTISLTLSAEGDPTRATSLFSVLLMSRGLGNVLSTPISTALSATPSQSVSHGHTGFKVDEGRYESMIAYVGTCFAVASTLTVAGFVRERAIAQRSP